MEPPSTVFRFGPYEARSRTRELYKHGAKLKLRPQPVRLLNLLLSRPGEVVTREQLREALWSAETFVDFQHSLNTSVKELRAALNDSVAQPQYIQTLPRLGYRFIAPVEIIDASPGMGIAASESVQTVHAARPEVPGASASNRWSDSARDHSVPRWWWTLEGISLLLIVVVLFYSFSHRSRAALVQQAPGRVMVAVMPFQNLTGDPGEDYLSDGLTEEMIARLGGLDTANLGVIARTSVMHYKHTSEPLDQIGRELGVQYLLEGSVRREGDKVRIAAQLIQMKDQTHIWSQQYDRERNSLLALEGEIAQHIAAEVLVTLDASKSIGLKSQTGQNLTAEAYEAHDLYLRGRFFWNKRTPQALAQAADYFQQAVAKDPSYAPAYAGLADSYSLMSSFGSARPSEVMPKARAAALRALELDDNLAEAHASRALIAQNFDWDWATAEREYRRAIQLNPNYATAHHWYAEYLALQGRFEEASFEMARARQLDPLSLIMAADNGAILYFSRQYDPAIRQLRGVLEMEPNFPRAHVLDYAYVQTGQFELALKDIESWRQIDDTPLPLATLAVVYGRSGHNEEAKRIIAALEDHNHRGPAGIAPALVAHMGLLEDKEQTLAYLEKACEEHSTLLTALKVDPLYDPLRNDPRFQSILHKVGLTQ
jgi:TolB-like protein/DNA-binding winged helix-turn-helix (wHTH) protein/Tfp pilus assembly protein PilF